jgi:hypothetical protein
MGGNKSYNMGVLPLSLSLSLPLIKLASSIIRLEIQGKLTFWVSLLIRLQIIKKLEVIDDWTDRKVLR